MNCPKCGSLEARIARTIMGPSHDIRQRRCRCGACWQTIEKVVAGTVQVKIPGEKPGGNAPAAPVKMVAAQNPAQAEKGGKGVSDPGFSLQPSTSDQDSNSTLLGKPRARRGRPSTKGYTDDFLRFWETITPRRGNKEPAFKAWVKFEGEITDVNFIIERYMLRAATSQWQRGFVQHVSTWLNERGWETEPEASEFDNGVPQKWNDSRRAAINWARREAAE